MTSSTASGVPSTSAPDPEISVVIATRNRAEYLDACLASITAQHVGIPFEVVVVDNGSTDTTGALLAEWTVRDPRVRVVHEPQVGLSSAKNAGARSARGTILVFTDDDVIAGPGFVAAHARAFERATADAVHGGVIEPVPEDLGPWPSWLPDSAVAELGLLHLGSARRVDHEYVWGANMAMRRAAFERLGPWDETVGRRGDERGTFEDTEYQDRARRCGVPVRFTPDAVVRHRVPRSTAQPRHVLRTAFVRGGYRIRIEQRERGPQPATAARRAHAVWCTAALVAWQLGFALHPRRWVFARAHGAARRAGRAIELVDPVGIDGGSTTLGRALRRVVSRSLRLTTVDPSGSSRRGTP